MRVCVCVCVLGSRRGEFKAQKALKSSLERRRPSSFAGVKQHKHQSAYCPMLVRGRASVRLPGTGVGAGNAPIELPAAIVCVALVCSHLCKAQSVCVCVRVHCLSIDCAQSARKSLAAAAELRSIEGESQLRRRRASVKKCPCLAN